MSRLDAPSEPERESVPSPDGPRALLLEARDVPLGGVRGMEVHRSLPHRTLPMVGAWCFLDRFGPQVARMRVEPHPHIGLQTVTWPFVGEVRHRDVLGSDVIVRPGVLNIMTSGHGIAHSEYSVGDSAVPLDALQLWVALPESRRHGGPDFERHENLLGVELSGGATATVVVGTFAGVTSPATMHTPIVGAEVCIPAGARVRLPLDPDWEYAIVGVSGNPDVPGVAQVPDQSLLYLGTGRDAIDVDAGERDVTLFLLGGEPFESDIVMWWNFVGRTHEEIVAAREDWEGEAAAERFGHVVGHGDERIPAPPLPGVRLTPRRRRD
ncbi:pirin family protein [uncultured Microbacterium sp.]|uniref:pirin family protein n=1 Tax=uncultured Microbacterium sp. TaxID=191216 RepID=UPI00262D5C97|nr:pirin family protein [uncultured Microbacterium sp.]